MADLEQMLNICDRARETYAYPFDGQKLKASVSHPLERFGKDVRGVSATVSTLASGR